MFLHKDKENGIENKTEITYDKAGNIIKIQDDNGAEESYEYDLLNRETQHTGKNGGVTRIVYDKNGRITRRILPNEYQTQGEAGHGYRYTYDSQGRVITVLAPDGSILETNSYDKASRLLQRRDATQSGVDYAYDLAGRIQTIRTPGGASQSYQYDAQGNIIGVSDGNQNKTEYKLDKWGRITEIVKADGSREYYGYDYAGNITETTDGEGNTIRYEYNLINKLKEITDPTGQTDTFHYDAQGRLKRHIDRNGNQIEYRYNIYDALAEKLELNSGLRETYEYHPDGKLKAAIAQGMRYSYRYYADGRLQEKAASGRRLLSYEYDLNGNKVRQTDVTGKTTEYTYNSLDLLTDLYENGNRIAGYDYNPDGTIQALQNGAALRTSYAYDADKNIVGLEVLLNGKPIVQNRYGYDGNGNRTHKEQHNGLTSYQYDNLNQVVKVEYPACSEELFYDKAGNRSRRIINGIEEQYSYDARNCLTSLEREGAAIPYQYDNAGNLLHDGDKRYSYDGFNRTTKVETVDGQTQVNRYDAEGLRYEMEENGRLVQFIFSGREAAVETNDAGINRLIRGHELIISDAEYAKTYYHYAADEIGSITHITDEDGNILNRYEYDAWGNITEQEETVPNRFKYTGQQLDPVTQQYYLRARFYNPVIARFTQEDTYRGDGLNLYAYCANNPVVYVDPSGYGCEKKSQPYEESSKAPHGNSKASTKPQHGYEISEKATGDVAKTGISGQPLNKDGTSPRANSQVNKWNKEAGHEKYEADVVKPNMPDRQTALDWEKDSAQRLWEEGNSMNKHQRPKPWED